MKPAKPSPEGAMGVSGQARDGLIFRPFAEVHRLVGSICPAPRYT
jgi:hypothetical protein